LSGLSRIRTNKTNLMYRKLELSFQGGRRYRLRIFNFIKSESRYSYDPANVFNGDHGEIMDILDEWKDHLNKTGQPFIDTAG